MRPRHRIQTALARTIIILAAATAAVWLTGPLTTLGGMIVGMLVVLAAEALLFTHRS